MYGCSALVGRLLDFLYYRRNHDKDVNMMIDDDSSTLVVELIYCSCINPRSFV